MSVEAFSWSLVYARGPRPIRASGFTSQIILGSISRAAEQEAGHKPGAVLLHGLCFRSCLQVQAWDSLSDGWIMT